MNDRSNDQDNDQASPATLTTDCGRTVVPRPCTLLSDARNMDVLTRMIAPYAELEAFVDGLKQRVSDDDVISSVLISLWVNLGKRAGAHDAMLETLQRVRSDLRPPVHLKPAMPGGGDVPAHRSGIHAVVQAVVDIPGSVTLGDLLSGMVTLLGMSVEDDRPRCRTVVNALRSAQAIFDRLQDPAVSLVDAYLSAYHEAEQAAIDPSSPAASGPTTH